MSWILTYTGRRFFPLDPKPEDVSIRDIAHALSNICRFTGHCERFYSVAQHSISVSHFVPKEHAMWALLHDAPEAYLADLAAPIKKFFPEFIPEFIKAEARIMDAVCRRFGLPHNEPNEVKRADSMAVVAEGHHLMFGADWSHFAPLDVGQFDFTQGTPAETEFAFIRRFRELGGVE